VSDLPVGDLLEEQLLSTWDNLPAGGAWEPEPGPVFGPPALVSEPAPAPTPQARHAAGREGHGRRGVALVLAVAGLVGLGLAAQRLDPSRGGSVGPPGSLSTANPGTSRATPSAPVSSSAPSAPVSSSAPSAPGSSSAPSAPGVGPGAVVTGGPSDCPM